MNDLIAKHIEGSFDYAEYRKHIAERLEQGLSTGDGVPESYVQYSKLNETRMNRIDKTLNLDPETVAAIEAIDEPVQWVVLTEGWCGDAAQNVPIIAALADLNPLIELHLILRDQHLELMDAFLTNGGRSIPKLIAVRKSTGEIIGQWGPRPEAAQQMVRDYKAQPEGEREPYADFQIKVQKWYAEDKGYSTQKEFELLAKSWMGERSLRFGV